MVTKENQRFLLVYKVMNDIVTITEFCQSISPECLINVFENMKR
jgi:hypothetical protein